MKINSKNIVTAIFLMLVITMFTLAILDMKERSESIAAYKYETIGKVYKFYSNRSNNRYYYTYYYRDSVYKDDADLDNFGRERCIGKYYRMHLSTDKPQFSEIFLDQEVTDSAAIVAAGLEYE